MEKIEIETSEQIQQFNFLKKSKSNRGGVPLIVWNDANKRWESRNGLFYFEVKTPKESVPESSGKQDQTNETDEGVKLNDGKIFKHKDGTAETIH